MKRARIAVTVGTPLALLFGLAPMGFAQDGGIFDRDRDSSIFEGDRPVFEQDRDREGLPYGATLLRAVDTECQGALLASGLGRDGDDVHGIRLEGEQVFRVTDPSVPWACLTASTAQSDVMECPEGTTDVRISHDGNVARFECYGPER